MVAHAGRDNSNRHDIFAVDAGGGKLTCVWPRGARVSTSAVIPGPRGSSTP